AGGNGRLVDDNSNFDGNANSRFAIAVAAVDHAGRFAPYSEPGANLLVTAPSNFFGLPGTGTGPSGSIGITTTDLVGLDGYNDGLPASTMAGFPDYTNDFGGTSSAAPLVSGIIALMLEANPNLTYRDVQHILAVTARKTDPTDLDWTTNAAGYHVNHNYGFGMVDAAAAVNLAKNWQNLPPQSHVSTGLIHVGEGIQDNQPFRGVTRFVEVKEDLSLEWVTLTFNGSHTYRGDLRIVLTSPSGTVSVLATPRLGDPTPGPFSWTFSTARLRGESAKGLWTVTVSDEFLQETGTFDSFQLDFYGVDPALGGVPPKPLPPPPSPPVTGVFQPGEQGSLDPRDNRSGADLAAVTSGPGQSADARGFNVHSGIALFGVKPYGPNFALGIRAAMADVTGDGVADLITVPGPGGGPHVKVFDGVSGAEIASFFAYDPAVRGGLFVAAGDVNGDGRADIVTGADAGGGPHVKVFNGGNFVELQSFMAFDPAFRGGVTVAVGDVDGDGRADVIVGAGAGGGPHVKVFSGATNALIASFMAYDPSFRGGDEDAAPARGVVGHER
ncbi:MAG TPA: proprotein convertase P-domain-containing protein, partial [Gemmataceae bacterium]